MAVRLALAAILLAAPATAGRSSDRRLSWDEGDAFVIVHRQAGFSTAGVKIPLPALASGVKRRVVFPARGQRFAVLDEASDEVGLHDASPRGSRLAAALVTGSSVRLFDLRGRALWTKSLPETHAVGGEGGTPPLVLGGDGSAAILLQDADPYTKEKPLVLVLDAKGRERLRLDYTSWTRVDDMLLSDDGAWLVVRGIGRVPADDTWGSALGHYRLSDGDRAVFPTRSAAGLRGLRGVDKDGRACCLLEGKSFVAVGHDGGREALSPAEAARRFGAAP